VSRNADFGGVLRAVVAAARSEQITFLAAGLAYYTFVSLMPLLLLAVVVASALGGEALAATVVAQLGSVLSPAGEQVVLESLTGASGRTGATVAGVAVLVWGALKLFRGLNTAFAQVYGTTESTTLVGVLHNTEVVEAVASLSKQERPESPVYFSLVGDEAELTDILLSTSHNAERIHICHAPTTIGMGERARSACSDKPDSSIAEACRLCAEGLADAVVTAGNPGAAVLSAIERFGLLPGVHRAALAAVYPTPRERGETQDPFSLILDVGASLRADARDLVSFAVMGSAYAKVVSENAKPRVALLSNSRESTIGIEPVRDAYQKLSELEGVHFYGNIEGQDIPRGLVDVIVCEGFVGDVAVKILEGVSEAAFELARSAYKEKFAWKVGLKLLSGGLSRIKQITDFEAYGGAPLLGIDQVMIVAHPRSQHTAVENAIKLAIKNVRADLPSVIAQALEEVH
jgi:glycerol-3-phosphate acyltransferase PlsX